VVDLGDGRATSAGRATPSTTRPPSWSAATSSRSSRKATGDGSRP